MIPEIREAICATPFVPFTIELSDGRRFRVPSGDHAFIWPRGTALYVYPDDDHVLWMSPRHITSMEFDRDPAAEPAS